MKMTVVVAAVAAAAGLASSALGDGRVLMTDNAPGKYNGPNPGGAFVATRATPAGNGDYNGTYGGDGTSGNQFFTFCIEWTEHFAPGTTYYSEIATSASAGGQSNFDPVTGQTAVGNDPISPTTAKIYQEFRNNGNFGGASTNSVFSAVNGGYDTMAETQAIQEAIWYAEGERLSTEVSALALDIYNWARLNNDGTIGDVRVLRLWTNWSSGGGYSGYSQDMLTIVPLPPAAWAGLGTMGCVLGFSVIRRRKLSV